MMVSHMSGLLPGFDGELSCIRCFAHVLNLVAKSLIRQFDVNADKPEDAGAEDEAQLAELRALAEDLDAEEVVAQVEIEAEMDKED